MGGKDAPGAEYSGSETAFSFARNGSYDHYFWDYNGFRGQEILIEQIWNLPLQSIYRQHPYSPNFLTSQLLNFLAFPASGLHEHIQFQSLEDRKIPVKNQLEQFLYPARADLENCIWFRQDMNMRWHP